MPPSSRSEEIKAAYKKESLRCHPDRLPPTATEAERARSTARFQVVADAYYTLSDPVRRREYDLHVPSSSSFPSSFPDDPDAEPSFSSAPPPSASSTSSFFSNLFGAATGAAPAGHADAEATFTSVFADLLEPEVGRERHGRMWSLVGGAGGAACGFIVGNLPGAAAGGAKPGHVCRDLLGNVVDSHSFFWTTSAFAGNRLGAIRDAKGKAVGEVFMTLGADRKAEVRLRLQSVSSNERYS